MLTGGPTPCGGHGAGYHPFFATLNNSRKLTWVHNPILNLAVNQSKTVWSTVPVDATSATPVAPYRPATIMLPMIANAAEALATTIIRVWCPVIIKAI